eukprot:TRINITY_DN1635_c0_g3_i1.p1 TRINITY_DN1635_c0_g3~~TRINITY_DN1635_c0_g3_i1.p1  ORF type:complete len:310 (-),score=71.30 TRINITY_DN1635_c0_g3_i1:6374-7303(-)
MKGQELLDAEEDKAVTERILLPCKSPELKANPLLHNKGLPKAKTAAPINPLKDTPIIKKKSKKFSVAFLADPAKSPSGYDVVGMSEFGAASELPGIKEILSIPLSEMNMDYLDYQRTVTKVNEAEKTNEALPDPSQIASKIARRRKEQLGMPTKPQSMALPEDGGMALFAENLSPEQFEFLKRVYAYKDNYYVRALSILEISSQYVSIFRYLRKMSESELVLKQLKSFASEAEKYARDASAYKGMCVGKGVGKKTCLLDLDETLIHATPKESKSAACVFRYIEEDGDDKELRKVNLLLTVALCKAEAVL